MTSACISIARRPRNVGGGVRFTDFAAGKPPLFSRCLTALRLMSSPVLSSLWRMQPSLKRLFLVACKARGRSTDVLSRRRRLSAASAPSVSNLPPLLTTFRSPERPPHLLSRRRWTPLIIRLMSGGSYTAGPRQATTITIFGFHRYDCRLPVSGTLVLLSCESFQHLQFVKIDRNNSGDNVASSVMPPLFRVVPLQFTLTRDCLRALANLETGKP